MSVIKKHRIQLTEAPSKISDWITKMSGEAGIERIEGPESKNRIRIQYDLEKIGWQVIEESLTRHHLLRKPTILSRLISMSRIYQEKNELDNLHTPVSPCCSDPKHVLNAHSSAKPR
jgi:hypothetical protein